MIQILSLLPVSSYQDDVIDRGVEKRRTGSAPHELVPVDSSTLLLISCHQAIPFLKTYSTDMLAHFPVSK